MERLAVNLSRIKITDHKTPKNTWINCTIVAFAHIIMHL